jgi:UDP-GlcNAc:undecaprenyl-phosphate GlcNAc-1-phosphate transferase
MALITIFGAALLGTALLMPPVIRLAVKINAVDDPDHRKMHEAPIPLLGGVVIALAFVVSSLLLVSGDPVMKAFIAGFVIITLTGLADDLWHLRPLFKFSGEIAASLIFLIYSGVALHSFGDLISTGEVTTGRYAIAVSVFCMIGVMNAMNMADGLDGLAGGISLIACMFLGWFSFSSDQILLTSLLVALMGCLAGFLYYNRYPARVFMGDTGSLVLGYVLSAICILMVENDVGDIKVAPISMAIVMGLPIVDAILVMTNRMLHGKNPFAADNTHLHHRLMALGLSHANTVKVIYILLLSCGLLAVVMRGLPEWVQFYAGAGYSALIFGTVYVLQYKRVLTVMPSKDGIQ